MDKVRNRNALLALSVLCLAETDGDVLYIGQDVEYLHKLTQHVSRGRMVYSYAETAHEYKALQQFASAIHRIEVSPDFGRTYSVAIVDKRFNQSLFSLMKIADIVVSNVAFSGESAHSLIRINAESGNYITAHSNTKHLSRSQGEVVEFGGVSFNLF